MIINLPTQENFNKLAIECLIQTTNNLYEIGRNYTEFKDELFSDVNEDEIWKHHNGDLRTCLVLIYQGLELFIKEEICKTSPFLLLETPRQDWPTNPDSINKDFNELYTISGDQLIRTFNAIYFDESNKKEINEIFNEIRKKRNIITHSSPNFTIEPKYLLETAIKCFTLFEGKDKWWHQIRKNILEHPLFGYSDYDYDSTHLIFRLNFIKDKAGIKFLNSHSDINLTGRKYNCPYCAHYLKDMGFDKLELAKWALLHPNSPTSDTLFCYSCQETFGVSRTDCTNNPCKGNVISEDNICLTCYEEIEEEDEENE